MESNTPRLEIFIFLGILLAVTLVNFLIFIPHLSGLLLGIVAAIIFRPIYLKLTHSLGGYSVLSALLTVILAIVLILTPSFLIGRQIVNEATNAYIILLQNGNDQTISEVILALEERVNDLIPALNINLREYAQKILAWLIDNTSSIFSGAVQVIFAFVIGILTFFYLLRDGYKFKKAISDISPLPAANDEKIFTRIRQATRSIVLGALLIAALQGFVTGLGFWIFGIPHPTLWGSIATIFALVPGVGPSLIIIPATAFLFFSSGLFSAIGILIWGIAGISLIDNLLGPIVISRGSKIHPFLILLSVLGGLKLLGPIGFLAGPMALALLLVLLDIYKEGVLTKT